MFSLQIEGGQWGVTANDEHVHLIRGQVLELVQGLVGRREHLCWGDN